MAEASRSELLGLTKSFHRHHYVTVLFLRQFEAALPTRQRSWEILSTYLLRAISMTPAKKARRR